MIGRGRLIADTSVDEFVQRASGSVVRVRSPEATELRELRARPGRHRSRAAKPSVLEIAGVTAEQIGETAAANASSCTS